MLVRAWLIDDDRRKMKWLYLLLAVFAGVMIPITFFFAEPEAKSRGLRICITAFVVNLGLFLAHRWAEIRNAPKGSEKRSWKIEV